MEDVAVLRVEATVEDSVPLLSVKEGESSVKPACWDLVGVSYSRAVLGWTVPGEIADGGEL